MEENLKVLLKGCKSKIEAQRIVGAYLREAKGKETLNDKVLLARKRKETGAKKPDRTVKKADLDEDLFDWSTFDLNQPNKQDVAQKKVLEQKNPGFTVPAESQGTSFRDLKSPEPLEDSDDSSSEDEEPRKGREDSKPAPITATNNKTPEEKNPLASSETTKQTTSDKENTKPTKQRSANKTAFDDDTDSDSHSDNTLNKKTPNSQPQSGAMLSAEREKSATLDENGKQVSNNTEEEKPSQKAKGKQPKKKQAGFADFSDSEDDEQKPNKKSKLQSKNPKAVAADSKSTIKEKIKNELPAGKNPPPAATRSDKKSSPGFKDYSSDDSDFTDNNEKRKKRPLSKSKTVSNQTRKVKAAESSDSDSDVTEAGKAGPDVNHQKKSATKKALPSITKPASSKKTEESSDSDSDATEATQASSAGKKQALVRKPSGQEKEASALKKKSASKKAPLPVIKPDSSKKTEESSDSDSDATEITETTSAAKKVTKIARKTKNESDSDVESDSDSGSDNKLKTTTLSQNKSDDSENDSEVTTPKESPAASQKKTEALARSSMLKEKASELAAATSHPQSDSQEKLVNPVKEPEKQVDNKKDKSVKWDADVTSPKASARKEKKSKKDKLKGKKNKLEKVEEEPPEQGDEKVLEAKVEASNQDSKEKPRASNDLSDNESEKTTSPVPPSKSLAGPFYPSTLSLRSRQEQEEAAEDMLPSHKEKQDELQSQLDNLDDKDFHRENTPETKNEPKPPDPKTEPRIADEQRSLSPYRVLPAITNKASEPSPSEPAAAEKITTNPAEKPERGNSLIVYAKPHKPIKKRVKKDFGPYLDALDKLTDSSLQYVIAKTGVQMGVEQPITVAKARQSMLKNEKKASNLDPKIMKRLQHGAYKKRVDKFLAKP